MPRREDDDVARRPGTPGARTLMVAGGFALAVVATLAVFLTDNPQYLRIAVVAVAWAFVIATFAAGRRGTDRVAAAAREKELRRVYDRELEREIAARREYELELENELRRETEDSIRYELDALRGDIAALSDLRDEVARVSALRGDIAALTSLRDEVARVAALRDDVAALNSLRQELGQLAELRADMGRLRAELTEQLSSEMLVERIVMRTQAGRLPADSTRLDGPGRSLDGISTWADDVPPRELTGGWPAVRLDEPRETQQFERVHVERAGPRPPVPAPARPSGWNPAAPRPWDAPSTTTWETPSTGTWSASPPSSAPPATSAFPAPAPASPPPAAFSILPSAPPAVSPPPPAPAEPSAGSGGSYSGEAHRSRHSAADPAWTPPTAAFPMSPQPSGRPSAPQAAPPQTAMSPIPPPPVEPPPSPLEWLAARSLLDPPAGETSLPSRRRRTHDDEPADPAATPTMQRPAVPSSVRIDDRGSYRVAVPGSQPAAAPSEPTTQDNRLAEILAENGVTPATGGRRRRRYRDDGESDDVLARVLGRN